MRSIAQVICILVIATSAASGDAVPVGLCARIADAPVIDGNLDDPAWLACEALEPFVRNDGTGLARQQTRLRVCSDGETLFIGAELFEADMGALRAEPVENDSGQLFSNDCLELFIQPDPAGEEYFHLVVDATGATYDAIATGGPGDWTPNWRARAGKLGDRWVAEAAIPLDEVRLGGVGEGQVVRLNACREEKPGDELSCWSCSQGPFHNAARFGELVFFSFAPLVDAQLAELDTKLAAAREVAGATPDFAQTEAKLAEARQMADKDGFTSADWTVLRPRLAALSQELGLLAMAGREAMVWRVSPWRLPAHASLPPVGTEDVEDVTVRLLQGEYETVALAVGNLTDASLAYHVTATDLLQWHEGREVENAGHIVLREAVPIRTRAGGLVRDALPLLQSQAQRMVIGGGENAVLWVTVHAEGLAAGTYIAGIDLLPLVGTKRRQVRLTVEVLPLSIPKTGPPYICNWADLVRAEAAGWLPQAVRDLDEHYVNVFLIRHGNIPWPKVDAEGNIVEPLDFAKFDARLDLLPEGAIYLPALSMQWFEDLDTDLKPWTPEHENALRQWAVLIRDHMQERGLGYERWAFYPKDEPAGDRFPQLVRNFADTVHDADPEIHVYANPFSRTTSEEIRVMGEAIDVWAPNLSGLRPDDLEFMKQHGKRVWSYLVLGRLSNPYGAYRLPLWRVHQMGLTGFGHWAYDSVDGSIWDDSDGRTSDYATCYEGPDGPIPSVRLESLREGVEDFRVLDMLRKAASDARQAGEEAIATAAEQALQASLDATLKDAGDSETADRERLKLLDALLEARAALGDVDQQAIAALGRPVPDCLTGNGGSRARNIDTGGSYTYSTFPTHDWKEQSGVTEGNVWLRAADAPPGPQKENGIGGDLTDGSWFYRQHNVNLWIWGGPKVDITFDLTRSYDLARVDVFAGGQTNDGNRVQSLEVQISDTNEEGSFRPVGEITDCPNAEVGPEGAFQIPASGEARYVRITTTKRADAMTIAEVRIWGR